MEVSTADWDVIAENRDDVLRLEVKKSMQSETGVKARGWEAQARLNVSGLLWLGDVREAEHASVNTSNGLLETVALTAGRNSLSADLEAEKERGSTALNEPLSLAKPSHPTTHAY